MKTISLLLLTLLGLNTVLFAQECGTPSNTQNQDFSSLRKKGIEGNTIFTINVYFHIVRNNRNLQEVTNNLSHTQLKQTLTKNNINYENFNLNF